MKSKKILIIIILFLIIIGGIVVYRHVESKEFKNISKVQTAELKNTQKTNQETEIFNKKVGNINEGQLLEHEGISKDIFKDTKYPGISDEVITKEINHANYIEPLKIVIRKYNPNILNQSTLVKYYNENVKINKDRKQTIDYLLLDVYNDSFAIFMINHSNKFNEFNVGNINDKFELVDNKNSMYCGIKSDGEITAYSNYGNNSAKKEPFILKK